MSTTAVYARRNQNLYRQSASLRMGPISVGFVTVAIITVLALLYLTQVTKTSVYGYKLSELTQQQQQLEQKNQELQVESARLQAIQKIQDSPNVKGLVAEQNVTYVK
jgi:hypothetical protein